MRTRCIVLGFALFLSYNVFGQTSVEGRWRVDGTGFPLPWDVALRADGAGAIFGAVSSCLSGRRPAEITAAAAAGNVIHFQCTSGDGNRTVFFDGKLAGDDLTFTWRKEVKGDNPFPADKMFGSSAPPLFTAKRISEPNDALTEFLKRVRRYPAVTFDRILHNEREPANWLTYSGELTGRRYSLLNQITPTNVKNLELAWLWQFHPKLNGRNEATPIVADGVLYTIEPPNAVVAIDAATGRLLWTFAYSPPAKAVASGGGGRPNRGLAMLGDKLFLGTLDAHLLAINANDGKLIWNTTVANAADPACAGSMCYVITHAPLVVKDKIVVGVAGSEGPIRGFIAAFDPTTGREVWRFHTVPGEGEPGVQTWAGESWRTGGAGVWNTGAYDGDLNLTFWGTGNPYPVANGDLRSGDNLYSDSVIALDADTGKLKWFYQFTPHDTNDWDAAQVPVLADLQWHGVPRKVMLWANRNGIAYVLDRATGEFLFAKPFVDVNWMDGFDAKGRPISTPHKHGIAVRPAIGGTNWYPPSFSPVTGLFYIPALEESKSYGAIRALDPIAGKISWEFKQNSAIFTSGVLSTASGLVLSGVSDRRGSRGRFYALDALTGQLLWQMGLPGNVLSGPMTYAVEGKQYVALVAGDTLFAFALRD
jgi:alcohol dehydrogenase (cytochrome c)